MYLREPLLCFPINMNKLLIDDSVLFLTQTMPYILVKFLNENDDVAMIPVSWMATPKKCLWPPANQRHMVHTLIRKEERPGKDWILHDVQRGQKEYGKYLYLLMCKWKCSSGKCLYITPNIFYKCVWNSCWIDMLMFIRGCVNGRNLVSNF